MIIDEIKMPRLGVNDDKVTLGKWLVSDKSVVTKGQKIAVVESTKESSTLVAPENGVIVFSIKQGEDVEVGKIIAAISDEVPSDVEQEVVTTIEIHRTFTKKAQELLDKHPEIDLSQLPTEGIIKESDVEKLISLPYSIEETMTNHVLIYGTGGICKDAIDIINQTRMYKVAGIIDFDYPNTESYYGIPIVGGPKDLDSLQEKGYNKMFSAVAFWGDDLSKHYRKNPYSRFKKSGYEMINIIDRSAQISATASMGEGNMLCANTFLGPNAVLGNDIIVNVGATINHDCIVSDHCHIASGAVLAGGVIIGENSLVGQGVTIFAGVKVGKNVTISNGCRVFKDVPDGKIVME